MAVAARKLQNEYAYMPATRVYSKAAAARMREEAAQNEIRRIARAERTQVAKAAGRDVLKKLSMMLTVAVAMGAILLVLVRYSNIAHAYASVNKLKDNIQSVEREITALNVELNSAVSLHEAREAAEEAGLGYPRSEQIIVLRPALSAREQKALSEIEVME